MDTLTESTTMTGPALKEISRRRTFAIISHPDAGKTTLTEKFLLYGGAVQLAGSVTARKDQRATTSDWMELEKQRGISVSSTVLQFEYNGCVVNLLDTPGHKDFSEDTYRVLSAVDAAIMVIDAGKGIESQTRKLFEVCRQRGVPIFTFINKLDRPARPLLELCDELESILGIQSYPLNWPLGNGPDFKGVYDRETKLVHLFERTRQGAYKAPVEVRGIEDEAIRAALPDNVFAAAREELDLLAGAGAEFSLDAVRSGKLTPVFFGSAANNFGVQLLLDRFLQISPAPSPHFSGERKITPDLASFSGFVFKIQANMNPKHRDHVAFIRVVSGKFNRDMNVVHTRTGKRIRLSNSQRLFARDRETVDTAWPGDVVGIVGNYDFLIGDTLSEDESIRFDVIPRFSPECFAYLHNANSAKYKQYKEGLSQLLKEGLAQVFDVPHGNYSVPLLGAVGPLQFEVLQYRLESEYGAQSRLETASLCMACWVRAKPSHQRSELNITLPTGGKLVRDILNHEVALLPTEWSLNYFTSQNPNLEISRKPF